MERRAKLKEAQRELDADIRIWQERWSFLLKTDDEDRLPVLLDRIETAEYPSFKTVLFRLPPGYLHYEITKTYNRLPSCLGTEHVLIEKFRVHDGAPSPVAFTVTFALDDLGLDPHLNDALPEAAKIFAAKQALSGACLDFGLGAPVYMVCEQLTQPYNPILWGMTVTWDRSVAFDDVEDVLEEIKEHLACDWIYARKSRSYVDVFFGVDPREASCRYGKRRIVEGLLAEAKHTQ